MVEAGWRSVEITAAADQISKGMAQVRCVLAIDGKVPLGEQSRTGANRQKFNASGIAQREVGKKKRLSCCRIIEEESAT